MFSNFYKVQIVNGKPSLTIGNEVITILSYLNSDPSSWDLEYIIEAVSIELKISDEQMRVTPSSKDDSNDVWFVEVF